MRQILSSVGPAIVVAAVVLGPGSILTSSQVGAKLGLLGIPVVVASSVLMMGMVALAARVGVVFESTPCQEISRRLGRPAAIFIGVVLFVIVALFQGSNNLALSAGLNSLVPGSDTVGRRLLFVVVANATVLLCLYIVPQLYRSVERLMKCLVGIVAFAFLLNLGIVLATSHETTATMVLADSNSFEWLPLIGLIGTTFSVGGAFYQAYLVRERGWKLSDARRGVVDSIVGISTLGLITCAILLSSWRVFYGKDVQMQSLADVAELMRPVLGEAASIVFSIGIVAGALSSFLVNAMIGGTVFADAMGFDSSLSKKFAVHLTTVALLIGMAMAVASIVSSGSTVFLITLAQALTVVGIPALVAALLYLATRPDLTGEKKTPRWILALAWIGLCVTCALAALTLNKVIHKAVAADKTEQAHHGFDSRSYGTSEIVQPLRTQCANSHRHSSRIGLPG